MVGITPRTIAVLLGALLGVTQAEPVEYSAATTSPVAAGCPSAIGLLNGGFEDGKIAPWTRLTNSNPTTKSSIVSPGFNNSKHALQLEFVPANVTELSLAQDTTGQECYGYYYEISYSWNWLEYNGPEGDGDSYCRFNVVTGYCGKYIPHYATRTPGWHHHSYVCRNIYSCHSAYSSYVVEVTCVGGVGANETLPSFTMQIDDFNIRNAPGSPTPLPTGPCF